jgi:hypothetical protein
MILQGNAEIEKGRIGFGKSKNLAARKDENSAKRVVLALYPSLRKNACSG